MLLNSTKELTPVVYGDRPMKVLHRITLTAGEMAFSLHWHDRLEMHRVRRGSLELFCADEQFTIHAGDVSVVSPRMLHRGVAGVDGVEYDVVMFDIQSLCNQTVSAMQLLKPLCDGLVVFEPKLSDTSITDTVDKIVAEDVQRVRHPLESVADLYTLLGKIDRCASRKTGISYGVEERFGNVISYINEHFFEPISSASLSAMFGYDEAYFCRKFKAGTGITVMKYIRVLRLEKARRLLSDTNESVTHIAEWCGSTDAAYFANCFRQQYQMTAKEWRETTR